MSVAYGGPPGGAGYPLPPGRVNFGWIGESFALFKANIGVWLVATLLIFVPSLIGGVIGFMVGVSAAGSGSAGLPPAGQSPFGLGQNALNGGLPPGLNIAVQIFSTVYTAWLYGGIYSVAVKQVRGEQVSIGDLFTGGPLLLKMLGFNILYSLAVVIGLLLCFVPGFLLSGLLFPCYALLADGETVGNAITRSIDAMKRDMWNAAAFALVMGLILIAGALACGLGLFVTFPMFFLAGALAYRDMIGMPGIPQAASGYGTPPGVWPPAPGAWPPPPQAYPAPPPAAPPRQSLSGETLAEPGPTPPEQGE